MKGIVSGLLIAFIGFFLMVYGHNLNQEIYPDILYLEIYYLQISDILGLCAMIIGIFLALKTIIDEQRPF